MNAVAEVDLLSPAAVADPQGALASLRERDPVHWSERHRAWILTRFDDVAEAMLDHRRLSSDRVNAVFEGKLDVAARAARAPSYRILGNWLVFRDPPDHRRLRELVQSAFTLKAVERLRPRVTELLEALLAGPLERGRCDLVRELAYPLPAIVIAELLGVPPGDRDRFKEWSDDVTVLVFGGREEPGRRERAQRGLVELAGYLADLVEHYRRSPADNIVSRLVEASDRDGRLSEDEIVSTCTLLLFGGHETTTNLLANGFLALVRHPDQLELLAREPSLAARAVEELNRFDGPSKLAVRRSACDHELHGRMIREHDAVLLAQCAANRDPSHFEDPDALDLRREPNRHAGFGFGIHYCLGAPLARMEAQVALPLLAARLRQPELAAEPEWQPLLVSRGLRSLELSFKPG